MNKPRMTNKGCTMSAVKERFMQILPEIQRDLPKMPDDDVQQIINVWFKVKPNSATNKEFDQYEAHMAQTQKWAKDHKLSPDDISKAIKTVRQRKKQRA